MSSWGKNRRRPVPPVQPQAFTVTVRAFAGDPVQDNKVLGARVAWDGQQMGEGITDGAGNFTLPLMPPQGFNLTVSGGQTDPPSDGTFDEYWVPVNLDPVEYPNHTVTLDVVLPFEPTPKPVKPSADLRSLRADGPIFRLPDGAPWRWKLVTAFDAPHLFHIGATSQLEVYAAWTHAVGGNGWRMFGGWSRTGLDFRAVPDYFDQFLPALCAFLGSLGLRGEFVCVTDGIPGEEGAQRDFLNHCADVLQRYPWMLLQYANEPYKNGLDPQRFEIHRPGLLVSKGAPPGDLASYPYVPSMGYSTHHPPRADGFDWARKPGKDSYDIRGVTHDVVIPDEPIGFAESKSGSRTNDPREAFVAGLGAALFCPGITAHGDSDTMQLCRVPGPKETACVREMFRGVALVPPEAPLWRYGNFSAAHQPDSPVKPEPDPAEHDGAYMHYMIGDRQAAVVNYWYYTRGAKWVAEGDHGWRVVAQDGPFALCERSLR